MNKMCEYQADNVLVLSDAARRRTPRGARSRRSADGARLQCAEAPPMPGVGWRGFVLGLGLVCGRWCPRRSQPTPVLGSALHVPWIFRSRGRRGPGARASTRPGPRRRVPTPSRCRSKWWARPATWRTRFTIHDGRTMSCTPRNARLFLAMRLPMPAEPKYVTSVRSTTAGECASVMSASVAYQSWRSESSSRRRPGARSRVGRVVRTMRSVPLSSLQSFSSAVRQSANESRWRSQRAAIWNACAGV